MSYFWKMCLRPQNKFRSQWPIFHGPVIFLLLFFALKNILVLLAKNNSGELGCPATALICVIFFQLYFSFFFLRKSSGCFLVWGYTMIIHTFNILQCIISESWTAELQKSLHWNFHCFKEIRQTFFKFHWKVIKQSLVFEETNIKIYWCVKWYWLMRTFHTPINLDIGLFKHQ